jgi:hypothetical protein
VVAVLVVPSVGSHRQVVRRTVAATTAAARHGGARTIDVAPAPIQSQSCFVGGGQTACGVQACQQFIGDTVAVATPAPVTGTPHVRTVPDSPRAHATCTRFPDRHDLSRAIPAGIKSRPARFRGSFFGGTAARRGAAAASR